MAKKTTEAATTDPGVLSPRDTFAAQMMAAILTNEAAVERATAKAREAGVPVYDQVAAEGYALADAALKAR